MAGFEGMTLTKLGQNLLAECMNGKNMKFSRVVVGSGLYTGNIEDIEDIIEKQLEIEIQNIKIEDETAGQINVQTYFNNENLENAFYFREIALYAIDDETNNEILYAYSNCGENAEYINVMSNETNNDYIEKYIDIVVKVGNINNVNVTIRKHLRFNDLSVEELAEIKTNVTNYYKRYERTYKTTEENETNIEIGISQYNEGSILEVYVEGRILNKDEYTINGTNSITLATPLSEIGTEVLFVVYRSVCAVTEDLDKLKGDKGDSGAIVFDSVADMKANTSLQAGDTCQTLGYYSVNDGGAGLYKIVNDDTFIDDGGSVHDLENGLKAELIINGSVNVKQFGATGDGITDDSTYIQNAIDYIASLYSLKEYIVNTIDFAAGIYMLDKQIKLYNFIKFNSLSNVIIRSTVKDKATLLLSSNSLMLENNNALSKFCGNWISGQKGGITLEYVGEETGNDIALQINEESNRNGLQYFTAWQNFGHIVVKGFTKGIYLYMKNLYLNTFDNVIFTKCTRCFETSAQIGNAGEKITFNNCVFGDSEEIGLVQSSDLELIFKGCSFDFVGKGIKATAGGVIAKFNQCHAEGVGFTNQLIETEDDTYLFCADVSESGDIRVFVDECDCMSIRSELFKSTTAKAMKLFLNSMTTKRKFWV